jgi:thioredoxin-like negative regulator of GroEL
MKKIIKFHTPQCISCQTYNPIFNKVASQVKGVEFQSLDATQNREIAQQYGIRGVPATIFLVDGKEVNRIMGPMSEQELIGIANHF